MVEASYSVGLIVEAPANARTARTLVDRCLGARVDWLDEDGSSAACHPAPPQMLEHPDQLVPRHQLHRAPVLEDILLVLALGRQITDLDDAYILTRNRGRVTVTG